MKSSFGLLSNSVIIVTDTNRLYVIKITKMYLTDLEITVLLTYLLNPGLSSFLVTKIKEKMEKTTKMQK